MKKLLFSLQNETYVYLSNAFREHLATKGYAPLQVNSLVSCTIEFFHRLETAFEISDLSKVNPFTLQKHYHYLETRLKFRGDGGLSASMIRIHMYALRLLFTWLTKTQALEVNPMSAGFDISAMVTPYRIALSEEQVQKLFAAAQRKIEFALLSLAYSGLRRSELSALDCEEILWQEHFVIVKESKGHKRREVPLPPKVMNYLEAYRDCEREELLNRKNKDSRKAFFLNKQGNRLSGEYCQILLKEICSRTDLPKSTTLHILRHSFATHLKLRGCAIDVIQELLGHSEFDTTAHYLRYQEQHLSKSNQY